MHENRGLQPFHAERRAAQPLPDHAGAAACTAWVAGPSLVSARYRSNSVEPESGISRSP